MTETTHILAAIAQGDPHAAERLLPLVYEELRNLAAQKLAQEAPGQTLDATALVHEAYLRLVGTPPPSPPSQGGEAKDSPPSQRGEAKNSPPCEGGEGGGHWNSRGHFFAAAAHAMRRILVESARRKHRLRHGGGRQRLDLDKLDVPQEEASEELLALDEALERLAKEEPIVAEVVKLRYFAGLTIEETAQSLAISVRTANRHWAYARAWLYQQLTQQGDEKV